MLDRRNFLQYFGIGATIVPLVAGMPKMDAGAKLIEVPKAEIVTARDIPPDFPLQAFIRQEALVMQVNFLWREQLHSMKCSTFITHLQQEFTDVTNLTNNPHWRERIPVIRDYRWKLEGIMFGQPEFTPSARAR